MLLHNLQVDIRVFITCLIRDLNARSHVKAAAVAVFIQRWIRFDVSQEATSLRNGRWNRGLHNAESVFVERETLRGAIDGDVGGLVEGGGVVVLCVELLWWWGLFVVDDACLEGVACALVSSKVGH